MTQAPGSGNKACDFFCRLRRFGLDDFFSRIFGIRKSCLGYGWNELLYIERLFVKGEPQFSFRSDDDVFAGR
jgi:hypothetical protein